MSVHSAPFAVRPRNGGRPWGRTGATDNHRYLVHFADGGAGMRFYDRPLEAGDEITDCSELYRVVRVEETTARVAGFGHAWAELRDG